MIARLRRAATLEAVDDQPARPASGVGIHLTFVFSGVLLALMDRLGGVRS